ncbi:hypothetical protein [Bacillus marinisedimentorum]|uniref:hypothetical protein n=1 Tax=Bacillus marinisedimentorum TaxID=1821260 RepID=UPI0007DFC969|nr:hypothetical protein [Bacillus marinisedimentorum]
MLKKMIVSLLIFLLLLTAAGCNNNDKEEVNENEGSIDNSSEEKKENDVQDENQETEEIEEKESAEEDKKEQVKENEKEDAKSDESNKDDSMSQQGMELYKPAKKMNKIFIDKEGNPVFTEKITAINKTHVQRTMQFGDLETLQILKWTANDISIVFEEENPENPDNNRLEDFVVVDDPEVLVGEKGNGWKVVDDKSQVEVPYQNFSDVLVLQKETDDGAGNTIIQTQYYASQFGLIKEEYEVTGDQGYKESLLLNDVN